MDGHYFVHKVPKKDLLLKEGASKGGREGERYMERGGGELQQNDADELDGPQATICAFHFGGWSEEADRSTCLLALVRPKGSYRGDSDIQPYSSLYFAGPTPSSMCRQRLWAYKFAVILKSDSFTFSF